MKTELIIFHRPTGSGKTIVKADDDFDSGSSAKAASKSGGVKSPGSDGSSYLDRVSNPKVPPSDGDPSEYFTTGINPNDPVSPVNPPIQLASAGPQGLRVDLYDNVSIPLNYTILDIREPDKRKTSWSKTITIPGTKNNNRIFNHIYDITKDGWVTIGNYHVFQGFNPNLRKEVVLIQDGIQVFKGNLQLKKVIKKSGDNLDYEIILNGDLTSLFFDVGNAKLSDLDFSEWNHDWSKENIRNSWTGLLKKSGSEYRNTVNGTALGVNRISREGSVPSENNTGRTKIRTVSAHGLVAGDYMYIYDGGVYAAHILNGTWQVVDIISSVEFTINYPYPIGLLALGSGETFSPGVFFIKKQTMTGRGYVYPLISWGDEYDQDSWPVTAMVPGIFEWEIFNKIMKKTNSTYTSNFIDAQFFKRLILIQRKDSYDVPPTELSEKTFRVGTVAPDYFITNVNSLVPVGPGTGIYVAANSRFANTSTASYVYGFQYGGNNNGKMRFTNESGGSGTGSYCDGNCDGYTSSVSNWDTSTYTWKVKQAGIYNLQSTIKLSAWADMNGFDGSSVNGTASFLPHLSPTYSYYPGNYEAGIRALNPQGPIGPVDYPNPTTGIYAVVTMKRKRNGVITNIGQNTYQFKMDRNHQYVAGSSAWDHFGRYSPLSWKNVNVNVNATTTYFTTGDEVWVEVTYYCQSSKNGSPVPAQYDKLAIGFHEYFKVGNSGYVPRNIMANFFVKIESPSWLINTPSPKSSENSELEAKNILPKDMSCKDYLMSLIKRFNLHIEPDITTERRYVIEPRDDYYYDGSNGSTDYEDWTDKLDETSVDIVPMGALIAKTYTFENKAENDKWNTKFRNDRGRDYMKYSKEIDNDFLKNEQKISVALGSTVMINNPAGSDVVMPAILQDDKTGFKPVSNSAPRSLIWVGLRPYSSLGQRLLNGWELLSSTEIVPVGATSTGFLQYYPYAGTVDSPQDPMYDLNWFNMEPGDFVYWDKARWSDHNLFNVYWRNMMTEISDPASLVVTADFDLSPADIHSLSFRKIYNIGGTYMRLQKIIDYDPVRAGLTKCEFLKLRTQSKYRRASVWVTERVEYTVNYDRAVKQVFYSSPPIFKKNNNGYVNTVERDGGSIDIIGKGNYVGSGKNIKINGNENAIGNDCANVNISNGKGNYISGSLTNVTLIGTDKKIINESDVTYINNVRFKNGVAISKSSVISGGMDVSYNRGGLNTNVNVVSAGEDIVTGRGSAGYENIINSGMDAILPDVPSLGLSTNTTPYPRTNYSGGAGYASPTQSMIDIVRDNKINSSYTSS